MDVVTTTFIIPPEIQAGLVKGIYERIGGVVRNAETKQVVAWLRDTSGQPASSSLLSVTSTTSCLNLGMSIMGFAIILQRLGDLERQLNQVQELLNRMNMKIDLGFYAKFRTALDLAKNALIMSSSENRRSSALEAIKLFIEAELIYSGYVDKELGNSSQIADEYLLTLTLAFLAEARCYLELDDPDAALHCLQKGLSELRPRVENYIKLLLTSNPAAYLDPRLKGTIDLRRLTRVFQWFDPSLDESAVFDQQRENLVYLIKNPQRWLDSLPLMLFDRNKIPWGLFSANPSWDQFLESSRRAAYDNLLVAMESMEMMIETFNRFEAYQTEVQAVKKLGMNFQDWAQLAPAKNAALNQENVMCIIPAIPLVFC